MSSILDALRRIEREEQGHAKAPFPLEPDDPGTTPRRRRLWTGTVSVVMAAGILIGALWLAGTDDVQDQPAERVAATSDPEAAAALATRLGADAQEPLTVARAPDAPPPPAETIPPGGIPTVIDQQEAGSEAKAAAPAPQAVGASSRAQEMSPTAGSDIAIAPGQTALPGDEAGRDRVTREPGAGAVPGAAEPKGQMGVEPAHARPAPATAPEDSPLPVAPSGLAAEDAGRLAAWQRPFASFSAPEPVEDTKFARVDPPPMSSALPPRPVLPLSTPDLFPEQTDTAEAARRTAGSVRQLAAPLPDEPLGIITPEPDLRAALQEPGVATPATGTAPAGVEPAPAQPPTAVAALPPDEPEIAADVPSPPSEQDRIEEAKLRLEEPEEARPEITASEPTTDEGEPAREEILRRPPRGAPRVRVNFLFYSREPTRRRVIVTVDGSGTLVTLFEGQSISSLNVERILRDEVHFRYEGKVFAVRPRY